MVDEFLSLANFNIGSAFGCKIIALEDVSETTSRVVKSIDHKLVTCRTGFRVLSGYITI